LMAPHSNWLWTVTTDPVWHFPHQNVKKYIKVSYYDFNMNIMQYFGKVFPCARQTGSVVTVQSQFECGTIKIKFLVFCLKGVIPLKNSS
jgi:hypothetical protein